MPGQELTFENAKFRVHIAGKPMGLMIDAKFEIQFHVEPS